MPNYVRNIVDITHGDIDTVQDFMRGSNTDFDFNKLIPMPESLNIESGSRGDAGYKIYREYVHQVSSAKDNAEADAIRKEYQAKCEDNETWELGKKYYDNWRTYGYKTWYEWCYDNWDTKWNACSVEELTYGWLFETAWSAPYKVFDALARQFPDFGFEVKYADEDIGYNCGVLRYSNGELVDEVFIDNGSEEAYRLACDVWDMDFHENFAVVDGKVKWIGDETNE